MRVAWMCVAGVLCFAGCGGTGLEACAANFAGCQSFMDATADNASRAIAFGGALGNEYAPKCLQVRRGQSVSFGGSFQVHPLQQACGVGSSLEGTVSEGMSKEVTLNEVGDFGYFCTVHGTAAGTGMAGLIRVVE